MRLIDADALFKEEREEYRNHAYYVSIDYVHIFDEIDNTSTVPAIPISVIEQIKAEIKNYLEDEKYPDDGISDVGTGLELALNIIDRVAKEYADGK